LRDAGVNKKNITIMIAPGTHRIMTEKEIVKKLGRKIADNYKIIQHDYQDEGILANLGKVTINGREIPIEVNRNALAADFIIGIGSIVPHSDAGYSGGAKIVEPGICGYSTTAATHILAALLDEIPLGNVENLCRQGIEKVTRKIGLDFIINIVKNYNDEIVGVYSGDFIKAHRKGVEKARQAYGVEIEEAADILIVSSYPFDIDWWQADKGLISASFAVKQGGIIILAAPCYEGLENNHPDLINWLKESHANACQIAKRTSLSKKDRDLIAADLAISNAKIREKAEIFIVTEGLNKNAIKSLGYKYFDNIQEAINSSLKIKPRGTIGVLPRGGDALPVVKSK